MSETLAYVAAGIVFVWGVMHVVPTRAVVAGFGDIGADNRRVITMEWVAEGLGFGFVASLLVAATWSGSVTEPAADLVYRASAGFLAAVGIWTSATGARTGVIWFRLCPVVMAAGAGLLVAAAAL
jgi:hypothetical protein